MTAPSAPAADANANAAAAPSPSPSSSSSVALGLEVMRMAETFAFSRNKAGGGGGSLLVPLARFHTLKAQTVDLGAAQRGGAAAALSALVGSPGLVGRRTVAHARVDLARELAAAAAGGPQLLQLAAPPQRVEREVVFRLPLTGGVGKGGGGQVALRVRLVAECLGVKGGGPPVVVPADSASAVLPPSSWAGEDGATEARPPSAISLGDWAAAPSSPSFAREGRRPPRASGHGDDGAASSGDLREEEEEEEEEAGVGPCDPAYAPADAILRELMRLSQQQQQKQQQQQLHGPLLLELASALRAERLASSRRAEDAERRADAALAAKRLMAERLERVEGHAALLEDEAALVDGLVAAKTAAAELGLAAEALRGEARQQARRADGLEAALARARAEAAELRAKECV